jgi:predicted deacylase
VTDIPQVSIAEFTLRELPPGKHRYWLEIFPTPEGALRVPLLVVIGRQGPVVFAAAGVHGDEFEGPEAIWQVCAALRPDDLDGIFAAIPVCNPLAYATVLRTSPLHADGLNLARVFPGDRNGTPTLRLAAALFDLVTRTLSGRDLFVDLHSGGTRYDVLPMVGYRRGLGDVDRSAAAARAFGIPRLWAVEPRPGMFNSETARIGIPTVGGEVMGGGGSRVEDVTAYAEGLLNMLRFEGILTDHAPPQIDGPFRLVTEPYADTSGFVRPLKSLEAPVAEHEVVAEILSPHGDVLSAVRASRAGEVWAMRRLRSLWVGEQVCWIGYLE